MTRNIILTAAAALTLGAAIPAHAIEIPMGFACTNMIGSMRCVNSDLVRHRQPSKQALMMKLKELGYPGSITVTDPAAYEKVVKGWRKTGDCYVEPVANVSHDKRVEKAKTVFCLMSQKGYDVPKPKIVKAY